MYQVKIIKEEIYNIDANCESEAVEIVEENKNKPIDKRISIEVKEINY